MQTPWKRIGVAAVAALAIVAFSGSADARYRHGGGYYGGGGGFGPGIFLGGLAAGAVLGGGYYGGPYGYYDGGPYGYVPWIKCGHEIWTLLTYCNVEIGLGELAQARARSMIE